MISRDIIVPEDVVTVRKTGPIVFLRDNVKVGASRNLLLMSADYDTVRLRTVLTLQ